MIEISPNSLVGRDSLDFPIKRPCLERFFKRSVNFESFSLFFWKKSFLGGVFGLILDFEEFFLLDITLSKPFLFFFLGFFLMVEFFSVIFSTLDKKIISSTMVLLTSLGSSSGGIFFFKCLRYIYVKNKFTI